MNLRDVASHWVALHEELGIGSPIVDEAQYARAMAFVELTFDDVANDPAHPLGGLVELVADRIRDYEARVHPWPDATTPASVLASLMEEHGLKQSDLPEVGAQSVVSAVLSGKRALNLRQAKGLAKRFSVSIEVFA